VEVLEEALLDAMVLARDKSEIVQIAILKSCVTVAIFLKLQLPDLVESEDRKSVFRNRNCKQERKKLLVYRWREQCSLYLLRLYRSKKKGNETHSMNDVIRYINISHIRM